MAKQIPITNQIIIPFPCNADWDSMIGNDRVRVCEHCAKEVHNLSAMSRVEAERLVASSGGKLCIRYYQLPDRKIQTTDSPSATYQIIRKTSRIAAGALGAALTLSANIAAEQLTKSAAFPQNSKADMPWALTNSDGSSGELSGTVMDINRAVIVGATVLIESVASGKQFSATTDERGRFSFGNIEAGFYTIKTTSPGFRTAETKNIKTSSGTTTYLEVTLSVGSMGEVICLLPSDALVNAALAGDLSKINALLGSGREVNKVDETYHTTAIYQAVSQNNLKMVKRLLSAGADVNGPSPALLAINGDTSLELLNILLKAGAKVNVKDNNGEFPLGEAAKTGNTAVLKRLLHLGANIEETDSYHRTPLILAASQGQVECVKVLIKAGAKINERDKDGYTALSNMRHNFTADDLKKKEIEKVLLAKGAVE